MLSFWDFAFVRQEHVFALGCLRGGMLMADVVGRVQGLGAWVGGPSSGDPPLSLARL